MDLKLSSAAIEAMSEEELDEYLKRTDDLDTSESTTQKPHKAKDTTDKADVSNSHVPSEINIQDMSEEELDEYLRQTEHLDVETPKHLDVETPKPLNSEAPSATARFGRGTKSGVYKLGMSLENAGAEAYKRDPELGFSSRDLEGDAHKSADESRQRRHAKAAEKIKPLLSKDDWLHIAGEWAGETAALAPLGVVGKGAQLTLKGVKPLTGLAAKYGKTVAGAGLLGGGSQGLKNSGINPIAVDLATIATPYGKAGAKRLLQFASGYSPKKLNVGLYDKALEAGIELPSTVTSNSKIRNLWDKAAGYSPTAARQLEKRNEKLHRQMFESVEGVADSIGPKTDAAFKLKSAELYGDAIQNAKGKQVRHDKVHDNLKVLAKEESTGGRNASFEAELAKELSLLKGKDRTPLSAMINRIKNTNDKVYDLSRGSNERRQQTSLKRAYADQLEEYAASTPEAKDWYERYKLANKHHAKAQLREEFEDLFSSNLAREIPEHFDLRKAAKAMKANPDVIADVKKYTPEMADRLDSLDEILNAIEKKGSKIKNPKHKNDLAKAISGLAVVLNPPTALAGIVPHIINSNHFYKKAIAAARQPTTLTIKNLNRELSKITGLVGFNETHGD